MKIIFPFGAALLLCCHQLAGYSNIPEYNSSTTTSYSNIGCYQDSREHERVTSSENQVASDDVEVDCESQKLADEACNAEANSPLMMAKGPLTYQGILKIDTDGTGPSHNDPTHNKKGEISYKVNGHSLNADTDSYVVAPYWVCQQGVRPGDRAEVYFRIDSDHPNPALSVHKTFYISSIVGDIGPMTDSVGEISVKAIRDLGWGILETNNGPIPKDPYTGRTYDQHVWVTYYPTGG